MFRITGVLLAVTVATATPRAMAGGTISHNGASFTLAGAAGTEFRGSGDSGQPADLKTEAVSVDSLTSYNWHIRMGDLGYRPLGMNLDAVAVYNGSTATFSWVGNSVNADNRFDAFLTMTIQHGEFQRMAVVNSQLTITNRSNGIRDFRICNYMNMDSDGSAANDAVQALNANEVRLQYADTPFFGQHLGIGASRYTFGEATTVANRCATGSSDDLNTLAGTELAIATPNNAASAYQWDSLNLVPGGSLIINSAFSVNMTAPEPGSLTLLVVGAVGLIQRRRRSAP